MFRLITRREASAGDPSLESWIIAPNDDRAADRLGIYAGMYRQRILDALAQDFPRTREARGDSFESIATHYLERHPSDDPSLRNIGRHFPSFLSRASAITASIEWARVEALDAEDATPLKRDALASIPPAEWPSMPLRLVPSARLAGDHLVWRRGFDVLERKLDRNERAALRRISEGCTFGEACEAFAEPPERIRAALEQWLVDQLLA
jgi:hypothetical protein